jgi:hypothetical protein
MPPQRLQVCVRVSVLVCSVCGAAWCNLTLCVRAQLSVLQLVSLVLRGGRVAPGVCCECACVRAVCVRDRDCGARKCDCKR